MSRLRIVVQAGGAIAAICLVATPAVAQPFELAVRKDRLFGADEGMLVFTPESITYQTTDVEDAREWDYEDLKQIQIVSPTRVVMATYQDQSWIKFGADRTFDFEVTGGFCQLDRRKTFFSLIERPPRRRSAGTRHRVPFSECPRAEHAVMHSSQ